MKKHSLILSTALLAATLPALQACFPVIATTMAVGVMSAADRRSTGVQTDDETAEWKTVNRTPPQYRETTHVNFISYNRRILITGEVPNEEARLAMHRVAESVEGNRTVINELQIGPNSSLASRSKDAVITSKVKARFVDAKHLSANHIKVFTEAGVVYLMGIVNDREAQSAIQMARITDGVRKVVNVMEILPDAEIARLDAITGGNPNNRAPVEAR